MKPLHLILPALALGGCAASYTEPALPADHPANAAAMEGPLPPRSRTLDLTGAEPVSPPPAQKEMDHMGHSMGDKPMGEPLAQRKEGGSHQHDGFTSAPSAATLYACLTHPEVTGDSPDQPRPKCGMKLKKQEGKQP